MKKITLPLTIGIFICLVVFSCAKYTKVQRMVNNYAGTWDVAEFKLNINKKDSSILGPKGLGTLFFDNCVNANDSNRCSVSLTIPGATAAANTYYPMGYQMIDKTKLKLTWMKKKYYFNIKETKSNILEFAGTDSLFSADNTNSIKATKK